MRIYLDTNVWCRPYDDLSQKRIEDESFAFEKIKNYTNDKIFEIIGSDILTNLIDCYHICSAIVGKAKYFITCDDKIIKKSDKIQSFVCKKNYELVILNVINFLQEYER